MLSDLAYVKLNSEHFIPNDFELIRVSKLQNS